MRSMRHRSASPPRARSDGRYPKTHHVALPASPCPGKGRIHWRAPSTCLRTSVSASASLALKCTCGGRTPCISSVRLTAGRAPATHTARPVATGLAGKALDSGGGGRVDHRHGREVDDIALRLLADPIQRRGDAGSGAEEEGAGDPVDDDVGIGGERDVIGAPAVAVRGRRQLSSSTRTRPRSTSTDCAMRCRNRSGAEAEADHDALGQVPEDDQQEGRQQHHRIAPRGAQQRRELDASRPCSRQTTASTAASAASGM